VYPVVAIGEATVDVPSEKRDGREDQEDGEGELKVK
jgi:hypothetical protein